MAGSKIEGFFGPPQVVWGVGEDPVTNQDFSDCGLTPAQTKELVQRVVSGQCLQSKQAKHPLHANAAFAELWLKEKLWGFLSTFREESRELAADLILRELNPLKEEPFDGFVPAELLAKGASQYLGVSESAVKKITQNAISKVRHKIGRSAHQVVWLDFSEGLDVFFPRQLKLQRQLKKRVLDLLREVFKGYDISFFLSEEEAKKSFPPGETPEYITVRFTYEEPKPGMGENQEEIKIRDVIFDPRWRREDFVEALRDKFGEEAVGETKVLFWAQAIKKPEIQKLLFLLHYYGTTNSPDLLSMDPPDAYFGNEHLEEEIQVFLGNFVLTQWHRDRVVTMPEMKEKTAEANRERLAQLLIYTVFHEMMHTFGIPHLPEHKTGPLFMMYGSESLDLVSVVEGCYAIEGRKGRAENT